MIAAKAGVTTMTVSNALRGKHNVSASSRRRILKLAKEMGYVPDPYVAKLMEHLRKSRSPRDEANLAYLAGSESPYSDRLFSSARDRAAELGYHLEKISTAPYRGRQERFRKVLRSRGVEGLLLGPLDPPGEVNYLDNWSEFSVVSLSHSIRKPRFDTVVPNQFYNTIEALRRVRSAGAQRPGLVTVSEFDERVNHAFIAAFAWDAHMHGQRKAHIFEWDASSKDAGEIPAARQLTRWLAEVRPDCAVFFGDAFIYSFLDEPTRAEVEDIAVVSLALEAERADGFPGINQDNQSTGATASEVLIRHIQQRITGVPKKAMVTMIEGSWFPGRGLSIKPRACPAEA